jgi:TonB family protein
MIGRRVSLIALVLLAVGTVLRADHVVYSPGDGITLPKPIKYGSPSYTGEAFRKKIQGKVIVEVVVQEDGTIDPDSVKVTRSLDRVYGLDDEAVKAVKQFRFEPGTKDGQPVAVRISIAYAFSRR